MTGQINLTVALVVIAVCSVAVVVILPAMALATARANLRGTLWLGVVTTIAAARAIAVAAVVGTRPASFSTLF